MMYVSRRGEAVHEHARHGVRLGEPAAAPLPRLLDSTALLPALGHASAAITLTAPAGLRAGCLRRLRPANPGERLQPDAHCFSHPCTRRLLCYSRSTHWRERCVPVLALFHLAALVATRLRAQLIHAHGLRTPLVVVAVRSGATPSPSPM